MKKHLALEMVRVTEAAAIASARLMGRGDRMGADRAATEAMRETMDVIKMSGTIVIGEHAASRFARNTSGVSGGGPPMVLSTFHRCSGVSTC